VASIIIIIIIIIIMLPNQATASMPWQWQCCITVRTTCITPATSCYVIFCVLQDAREALAAVRAGTHKAGLRVMPDSAAAAPQAARQAHQTLLQPQRSVPLPKQQQQQQQHERSVPLQQQQQQLLQQQSSGQELPAAAGSSSSSSSRFPEIKVAWQVGSATSALSVVPERSRSDHAVLWVALNRKIEWYPSWEPGTKSEMAVAEKVRHDFITLAIT
jgi:hypothetical protein